MAVRMNPYLVMDGNAKEAIAFYEPALAGKSITTNHADRSQQIFDALAEGGRVSMPLQETSWSPDLGVSKETLFKLYSLHSEVVRDIPGHDSNGSQKTFDDYCERFHRAQLPLECQLFALDGETWVGLAILEPRMQDGICLIDNDLTGVDRGYRGHGIAQALNVLAVQAARHYGAAYLWTRNDEQNTPILAINRKMGYRPQPGTYSLVHKLV